jgi:hypothetical protein
MTIIVPAIALLAMIGVALLLRHGFVPVKTADYPLIRSTSKSWDEVFASPGRFTLFPWQPGA